MRVLIVHNPRSGFGSDAVFAFEREVVRAGDECLLRVVKNDFTANDALVDAEDFDVVVLSGGDGTVSNLLYELKNRAVTACIFPSGTANLIFANIGNSPEPAALARACRWGETTNCDMGEIEWCDAQGTVQKRGFSLMAGSGYDAELMSAAAPNKRAFGEAAYFLAVLSDPNPHVYHYVIDADGTKIERDGIACLVANTATIQGEIEIVPDCRMDDGLLDIIVLEAADTTQLIRPALAGIFDRKGKAIQRPHIETFRCKNVTVTADAPILMQVDGDVIEGTVNSWSAHVIEGANRVVVDSLSNYAPTEHRDSALYGVEAERAFPE